MRKYETNSYNILKDSKLAGDRPVGYLQSMVEFRLELPKTNPACGREEIWTWDFQITSPVPYPLGYVQLASCYHYNHFRSF